MLVPLLSRPEIEALVDSNAAALALPLAPEHRPGVIENFTRICVIAQSVMEFPLPAEAEPAPVFTHAPD
jgi:hypothetical protein